ncbi:GFA family protein [Nocardia takedensis]
MREGGCLCGHIRYRAEAEAIWPHLCSCAHCQRLGALR